MRAPLTLLCCLLALASLSGAEPDPHQKLFDEAKRAISGLQENVLPAPNPDGDTEEDLLQAMAHGDKAVDPAFYRRLGLDELTDRLLPVLEVPFRTDNVGGSLAASRLFLMRGHKLCQEGKVAEGQAWLLKAHRMARRPEADGNLLRLLTAIALEHIALSADGAYVGTWSQGESQAYVRALEALPPLPGLRHAVLNDDLSLNEPTRFRTLLPKLKPLTSAERRKKLVEHFPGIQNFEPEFLLCYDGMIDNLTPADWDDLLQNIAGELEPLNPEKLRAFKTRVVAAQDFAKDPAKAPNGPMTSMKKAEAFYLALLGAPIERTAGMRLDLDLKTQLLKAALQRGAAFSANDLAGLASVADGPLKLGVTEDGKRRAILAGERGHYFMSLERKR
jgi:hypothetical protein